MSKREAVNTINEVMKSNKGASRFFKVLTGFLVVVAVVIAFLAAHVEIWLGIIEVAVVIGLKYSLGGVKTADNNNVDILRHSSTIFHEVNSQVQLKHKLTR